MADDFQRRVIELNRDAEVAHARYLATKEEASEAKKGYEARVLALQEFIANYSKDLPLFPDRDDTPQADARVVPDDTIDVEFEVTQPQLAGPVASADDSPSDEPPPPPDESWRSVPLDDLAYHGLTDRTIGLLAENGLKTIGDVSNWSNSGKQLTDLDGIGEAKATEIEEAMEAFWKHRASATPPAEDKPKRRKKSA